MKIRDELQSSPHFVRTICGWDVVLLAIQSFLLGELERTGRGSNFLTATQFGYYFLGLKTSNTILFLDVQPDTQAGGAKILSVQATDLEVG